MSEQGHDHYDNPRAYLDQRGCWHAYCRTCGVQLLDFPDIGEDDDE